MISALQQLAADLRVACSFQVVAQLRAPWGISIEGEPMCAFHYVAEGACVLMLPGEVPLSLEAGDLVWMPRGLSRVVADRPGREAVPLAEHVRTARRGSARFELRGDGPRCSLYGAGVRFQGATASRWLQSLPRLSVLRP
ncbi:MAG: cupin domain-containing protein [Deltaproteobacteria bacterium]|nr:cupin domain-containing protein [Deltaproteobacteria bacterium]